MKFITNESTIDETSKSHNQNPKNWKHKSLEYKHRRQKEKAKKKWVSFSKQKRSWCNQKAWKKHSLRKSEISTMSK